MNNPHEPNTLGVKAHDIAQAVADLQARVEALERKVRAASIGELRMTGLPFNADGTPKPAPTGDRAARSHAEDVTQYFLAGFMSPHRSGKTALMDALVYGLGVQRDGAHVPLGGFHAADPEPNPAKAKKWIWATFSEAEIVRRTGGDFKRRKGVYYIRPKGAS